MSKQQPVPIPPPAKSKVPDISIPLTSSLYVERPPTKYNCYKSLLQAGALIRIKAPKQIGKTLLVDRIVAYAAQQNYRTVGLNLLQAEEAVVNDAIVSSDNTDLRMSGSVSGRIREGGGNEIYRETKKLIPLRVGHVAVTQAGNLQAKKIFHGSVIDWQVKILLNVDLIQQVIHNYFRTDEEKFHQIAFLLLGTGAGSFPKKLC